MSTPTPGITPSSGYTPNYGLPLFGDDDPADFESTVNVGLSEVDRALKEVTDAAAATLRRGVADLADITDPDGFLLMGA